MPPIPSRPSAFRKVLGFGLIALAALGVTSLCLKEFPLALFGEHTTGTVTKVEVIQTSNTSTSEHRGIRKVTRHGSDSHFMYIAFATKDGVPMEVKTLATFNTEAKVGDTHPMIYLPSNPERAKIHSAKQLWLPMIVGSVFSTFCLLLGTTLALNWPVFLPLGRKRIP